MILEKKIALWYCNDKDIEIYQNYHIFCLLIYINNCSIKLYNLLFYRVCNVHGVKNACTYMEYFTLFLEISGFESFT